MMTRYFILGKNTYNIEKNCFFDCFDCYRHVFDFMIKFISSTWTIKIRCLCLLWNLVHFSQLQDVSIFDLQKQNCKQFFFEKTFFLIYNFDKASFISLIQKARHQIILLQNELSTWWTTEFVLYNLIVIF